LVEVVREGMRDVVLDLSFWSKRSRDEYRELVREEGKGRYGVELVVFRGGEEVIWRRLRRREEKWEKEGMGKGDRLVGSCLAGSWQVLNGLSGRGRLLLKSFRGLTGRQGEVLALELE
jgi:hypothetical protein